MKKRAITILSGGLDSSTVLAIAKDQGYDCYAMTFDYGQRNRYELNAAVDIAKSLSVIEHKIFPLSIGEFRGSALTDHNIDVPDYTGNPDIPVTYVPARNTIFLSIALGWAEVIGACDIFTGISSVDYSHYPDCRPEYVAAFQRMANLATKSGVEGHEFKIHAPLVNLSKADTIKTGIALGMDYSKTISCYQVNEEGLACGRCDSCTFRKKGFREAGEDDPTRYVTTHVS